MTTELKPCPFCGGTAVHYMVDSGVSWAEVGCTVCDATHCDDKSGDPDDGSAAVEAWNHRHTPPLAHLSDPEWEGMKIERAFKLAQEDRAERVRAVLLTGVESAGRKAAEARAEAAERRVAELERALSEMRTSVRELTATAFGAATMPDDFAPHRLAALSNIIGRLVRVHGPIDEWPDALLPVTPARDKPEATPKAPTVHGIPLAVGQRWVHAAGDGPQRDVRIRDLFGLKVLTEGGPTPRTARPSRSPWPKAPGVAGCPKMSHDEGRMNDDENLEQLATDCDDAAYVLEVRAATTPDPFARVLDLERAGKLREHAKRMRLNVVEGA
jgi:hypothetical protein